MTASPGPGKIITFYSYKGGTGRSLALSNVAWILASAGKRVLVLDWDLEAPGLHRYFQPFLQDKDLADSEGIIDFVIDFAAEATTPSEETAPDWYLSRANILRYARSLNWKFPKPGTLDFVPAGRQDSDYATRVNSFNWQHFYEDLGGGVFLEATKKSMAAYDYVLIDSRTGVSDTSGICTIQMPDVLAVCFTLNNQSIEGAAAAAESAQEQRRKENGEPGLRIFPVAMRVERAEKLKLDLALEYARIKFDPFLWHISQETRDRYWGRTQVFYEPYYAYEEVLATFRDKPLQTGSVLSSMEILAEYLTDATVTQFAPIPDKQSLEVLARYERRPNQVQASGEPFDMAERAYLALNPAHQELVSRLLTRLIRLPSADEAGEPTRIQVGYKDLAADPQRVVVVAQQSGLVTLDPPNASERSIVSIADESWPTTWPRLQDWLAEDREFLLWRQQLRVAVASWRKLGRDESALLRGNVLDSAVRWLETRSNDLTEGELDFICSSGKATGPSSRQTIRVFVSSPGDVAEEREIARRVLQRLTNQFAPWVQLEPIFWEHEPLLANDTFHQYLRPSESDIAIFIFWSRLGTRLPPQFTRPDGSRFNSGTEFEFEDAMEGRRQRGLPDLLVYRKTAQPVISLKDMKAAQRAVEQCELLDEFVRRTFHGEDGTLVAAFNPYDDVGQFEVRLEEHLRKLIERRLQRLGVSFSEQPAAIEPSWKGSPFRGLQVFEFQHQEIFFGRTQATSDVIGQLRRQAEAGRAFLLVSGAGGSGKSSLVRAGVLPLLGHPGVIEGVSLWRRAVMRRSDRLTLASSSGKPADLFDVLVEALLSAEAVPELVADGTTFDRLGADLRANPSIVAALIKGALSRAASDLPRAADSTVQPTARLIVVLDQLEELFGPQGAPPAEQQSFFRAISSLAASGHTWILATLRSDFFHRCTDIPELSALIAAGGTYSLQPPDATEIGQLIRRPAAAAGLRFEEEPQYGARLDDLLRDAAVKDRGSLPLLEFTLEELYHQRQGSLLTLAAYRQLGGIDGAIGRRADEVFSSLPPDAKAALPRVFRQLAAVGGDDGETVIRRPAPIEQFDRDFPVNAPTGGTTRPAASPPTAARRFVEVFVAARLFTAKEKAGVPVVEVSHEGLLTRWKQAVDWLETDKKLLRYRAGLERAATKWLASGQKSDLLLPAGTPLEEGLELLRVEFPINDVERELITASRAQARRLARVRRMALAMLVLMTLLAVSSTWLAMVGRKRVLELSDVAEKARAEAQQLSNALTQLKGIGYGEALFLANREFINGEILPARHRLDDTQTALRGWEWKYLTLKFNDHILSTLAGDTAPVNAVAFSPNGTRLASASADKIVTLWDAMIGKALGTLAGHTGDVLAVAFSPEGGLLASASTDKTVRLWDAATGAPRGPPLRQDGPVLAVAFSPDGRTVLTGSADNTARLWDAATGAPKGEPLRHEEAVDAVAFSPDGRTVLTGSADNTARLWDAATGAPKGEPMRDGGAIDAVAFSPDGRTVLTGSADNTARLWDAATGAPKGEPLRHEEAVDAVAFSPDGRTVLTGSADHTARLWDAATGAPKGEPMRHEGSVLSVGFSPDGFTCVTAGGNEARLWNATTAMLLARLVGHTDVVVAVAFSPDGIRVASGSHDKTARLWDAAPGKAVTTLTGATAPVKAVAFSPKGLWFVSAGGDHVVRLWDAPTGKPLATLEGHSGPVTAVAFSPDGPRFASASADKTVRLWDAATGKPVATLAGHTDTVNAIAFNPDGTRLASASDDGTVRLWDVATPRLLATLEGHTGPVLAVAFSPAGTLLASASLDKTVRLWDVASSKALATLEGHTGPVLAVAFSPKGTPLASASADKTVRLWDAATGKPVATLEGHTDQALAVVFNPAGTLLASASDDRTVRLWDGTVGRPLATLEGHTGPVSAVAFNPDGTRIASASEDKTMRVWDAKTGAALAALDGHTGPISIVVFSPDGVEIASGSDDKTARLWFSDDSPERQAYRNRTYREKIVDEAASVEK